MFSKLLGFGGGLVGLLCLVGVFLRTFWIFVVVVVFGFFVVGFLGFFLEAFVTYFV